MAFFRTAYLLAIYVFSNPLFAGNFSHYPLNLEEDSGFSNSKHVRILDTILLDDHKINKLKTDELSDIAWDDKNNILYAITDEGNLFHIAITTINHRFTQANFINGYKLKNKKGKKLKKKSRDSEGLALYQNKQGNTELLISFEHKHRIRRYSLTGDYISKVKLPDTLKNKANYLTKNKGLESVILHPGLGILTASERPLKNSPTNLQTIYASDGKFWHFPESKYKESSITSIEVLNNGDLLILERAWQGLPFPIHISLRQLQLTNCENASICSVKELAHFSTADGWRLDNFEGLTHYKDDLYLMVSDNNEHPLQNTLLVLLEIINIIH